MMESKHGTVADPFKWQKKFPLKVLGMEDMDFW